MSSKGIKYSITANDMAIQHEGMDGNTSTVITQKLPLPVLHIIMWKTYIKCLLIPDNTPCHPINFEDYKVTYYKVCDFIWFSILSILWLSVNILCLMLT